MGGGRHITMLARAVARAPAMRGLALTRMAARPLCAMEQKSISVDMVCRMWSMKVKNDETAYQMDLAFDEMIDDLGEVPGCEGASRLVCKSEWDYKFILKFEDLKSLQDYMKNDHDRISDVHLPKIKTLAVGDIAQQNFVYDDINE